MILHCLNDKMPDDAFYWVKPSPLEDYQIDELIATGADEAWYWYGCGSYEGDGYVLLRKGNKYDLHDMSHCSCYGPTDRISTNWVDYEKLKETASDEFIGHCALLLEEANPNK